MLPDVGSTIVPPGRSAPDRSAASIMRSAIRSFTEPPGLKYSTLARTVAGTPSVTRLSLTSGVLPISVHQGLVVLHGRSLNVRYIPSVAATPAIQIAPGVWRIPTAPADLVNSFAFVEGDGQVTLVDAGTRFAPRRILAGLRHLGAGPGDVTRLLVTHAHGDHAGGLARMRGRTGASVGVHERDAAYVREGRGPVLDRSTLGGRLFRRGPGFSPTKVDEQLYDGQVLDVAGGLRVVHTPGHTPRAHRPAARAQRGPGHRRLDLEHARPDDLLARIPVH